MKNHFLCRSYSLTEMFYTDEYDKLAEEHENFEWHVALSDPLPEEWKGIQASSIKSSTINI